MDKKIIALKRFGEGVKYFCRKCGAEMVHGDDYHMGFGGGEIWEYGGEYFICPECGHIERDEPEYSWCREYPSGQTLCPECLGMGEYVKEECGYTVYSCTRCDCIWRTTG